MATLWQQATAIALNLPRSLLFPSLARISPHSPRIFAMAIVLFTLQYSSREQAPIGICRRMNYRLPDEHLMMYTTRGDDIVILVRILLLLLSLLLLLLLPLAILINLTAERIAQLSHLSSFINKRAIGRKIHAKDMQEERKRAREREREVWQQLRECNSRSLCIECRC